MQIGYSDNIITYTVGARTLPTYATANDLGIAIQSSLKPEMHSTKIAAKTNVRAKLKIKAFLSHDAQSLHALLQILYAQYSNTSHQYDVHNLKLA